MPKESGSTSAFDSWFKTNSPLLDLEEKLEPAVTTRVVVLKPSANVPAIIKCEGHAYLRNLIVRQTGSAKIEDGERIAELAVTAITTGEGRLYLARMVNTGSIVFLGNLLPQINPEYDRLPLFEVHEVRDKKNGVVIGPLVLPR